LKQPLSLLLSHFTGLRLGLRLRLIFLRGFLGRTLILIFLGILFLVLFPLLFLVL
jgi:hypothetical protein